MERLSSHWTNFKEILTFEKLWKICQENSNFTKIWQEFRVLYMKTNIQLYSYLAQFFLECEMFPTNLYRKSKHTFYWMKFFFRKSRNLWDNVEKHCRAGQVTDDNMAHAHCMLNNYGYKLTLRMCDAYCFSTKIMVTRTCLNVTFIRILPLSYYIRFIDLSKSFL